MAQAALVSFDIEKAKRVIDTLDCSGHPPEVALWALLPQYDEWRFVLSSSRIHGYEEMVEQLRNAGVMPNSPPSIYLREISDPFITQLREKYAGLSPEIGYRISSQYFGRQYVDEAYVYRIR
jgi:hypothetical protein